MTKRAIAISIVLVRDDGQAGKNEAVVWSADDAAALMRSTYAQFRTQCRLHDQFEAQMREEVAHD